MMQHHFAGKSLSKQNTILKVWDNTKRKVEIISMMGQLSYSVYKDK